MNILVTAGGTREYIDGVRYIGNCSSGQTGADLVDYLNYLGHQVTWLGAKSAVRPSQISAQIEYETFDELASALKSSLAKNHFDVVFQAAAVSDFKVSSVLLDGKHFDAGREVKLPTADEVQLVLSKQPKLVSSIKTWSANPEITVVAFKLTNSQDTSVRNAAITKLINQAAIDMVAHNDLNEISDTAHAFSLFSNSEQFEPCADIKALAEKVIKNLGAQA